MKGYHVSRSLSQHSAPGPCHCIPEDCDLPPECMPLTQDPRAAFEPYPGLGDHHHYYPAPAELSGGTFPRSLPSQSYDCEECLASHHPPASLQLSLGGGGKIQRLPPTLLDQFEKQLPFRPEGFHTLQYQRGASGEQRSESPSRIRHLVNSVQRLFAKSHSLEAPLKREYNGTRAAPRGEEGYPPHPQHYPRQHRRSKSRDRKELRQRSRTAGWWSSDDNLESDSGYLVSGSGGSRAGPPPGSEGPDSGAPTLKSIKGKALQQLQGECMACSSMALAGEGGLSLKRNNWSSLTVSQAREGYPGSGLGYDKALVLHEPGKTKERAYHFLQVPSDDWGGGYPAGGKLGGEIPCRRMRSGSYIKAMGDDDSGDSDASPKPSPKTGPSTQREAFRRSVSMDHRSPSSNYSSCKQCSDYPSCTTPKVNLRARSYSRSLTATQVRKLHVCWVCVHLEEALMQIEGMCESVLGLCSPRGGSDADRGDVWLSFMLFFCPPPLPLTVFPHRKHPPPVPPRISKPMISITAQSSTESQQDSYPPDHPKPQPRSNSTESLDVGRSKLHSNSADNLLEGVRGYQGTPSSGRPKPPHSSSADSVLDRAPATPKNNSLKMPGSQEHKSESRGRKWRPSIAVQVDSSDSDSESKALREFHSIGVQVEEDRRRARFKRSNSVTASVQADLGCEGVATEDKGLQFGHSFQRHSSEPESVGQYGVYRTVHTQGEWAYREDCQPLESGWSEGPPSRPASARDGEHFLKRLQAEVERMEGWCQAMEREAEESDLGEEVLEMVRCAVGSAQLLMTQKIQQFFRLCQQSLDPSAYPQPTPQDLAGLWDQLQLSIEDVRLKFQELQRLKDRGWKIPERKEDKKIPPLLPKKSAGGVSGSAVTSVSLGSLSMGGSLGSRAGKVLLPRDRSLDLVGDRQRQEARWRLLAGKRTASFRQNSATESADSIEIYIPEAQTRL
ncbi:disks large-associated protein 3-like [Huso huso]|uniref:Disks large-associated protein 3-like n=1 Tax=Huso huso TaxID=61971 RepID=A0ABR0YPU9_HUSHU